MRRKIKELFYICPSKKHIRFLPDNDKTQISGNLKTSFKHSIHIFCVSLFFIWLIFEANAFGNVAFASNTSNHIDAIIVMDTSGSMNDSDKDRVSIEAAKMFVDMMDINGSRVGMLGFNDSISPRIMMSDISNKQDKEAVKEAIESFSYQGYTDIGMALKQAQFIYENASKSENSPIVLLFTDGNIEMDESNTERTYSESIQDINDVIKDAKDVFPIYTIGLNSNGEVDETLLHNISNATEGRCYVTNSPKDLPTIFNEIFADHIKSSIIDVDLFFSDGTTYKDVTINIPDDNVIEANIIIFSDKELIDTKIVDPNGVLQYAEDSSSVVFSKSAKYSIIKLLRPLKGDWVLSISGQKEDLIKVNLLFEYQIYIDMKVSPLTDIKEGTELNIELDILSDSSDNIDSNLSETFRTYFLVADQYGNELDRHEIFMDKNGSFSGIYTLPKEITLQNKQISVYCVAESDRLFRESNSISLDITQQQKPIESETQTAIPETKLSTPPPVVKSEIQNVNIFYIPVLYGKKEIELSDYFENAVSYKVSDVEFISVELTGSLLTITPKSKSNGRINVIADNGYGGETVLSFAVGTFNLLPYILIAISIIAIILFAYFFKKSYKLKNTLFSGNVRMVAIDSQGSHSPPELIDLSYTAGVTNLRSIVQDIDNGTLPLHKIRIYPAFDSKGLPVIGVINNSSTSLTSDFDIKITGKKFMWHSNLTLTIVDESNAEASVLELEYRN